MFGDRRHSDWCEVVPHCGFDLHFSNNEWYWVSFHVFVSHLYVFFAEKAMAPHSSTLAWKIPWMEEPGRLQSMGLLRVGHDWVTSLSLFTFMCWRRKWQPTPVFLPGESQGQGRVGCRLWGHTVGHDWSYLAAAAAEYEGFSFLHIFAIFCYFTF